MPPKKFPKRGAETGSKISNYIIAAVGILVLILSIAFYTKGDIKSAGLVARSARLRFWGMNSGWWHENDPMRTMKRVFERLQYKFVNGSNGDDWDILWSTSHPGEKSLSPREVALFADVNGQKLRPEQKVNHFDGIEALTSKSFMGKRNQHLPYILPLFYMPEDKVEFEDFIADNPGMRIIEKNNYNRGVKIIKVEEVKESNYQSFYQQFMDDPFLVDGHAFDFGVFVLITSFDPVRIYRYSTDVLFRFCKKPYHPFDPSDRDRYVVEDGAFNAFEMPLFADTYKLYRYPFIDIFERYVKMKGFDVDKMWKRVDDAIVKVILNAESHVINETKNEGHSMTNYFEIVRFDFLFDSELNPYIMEVNMSPNLTPASERYEENCNMYEQLVYDAVKMVGGASYFEFMARTSKDDIIVANKKNIAADIEKCLDYDCHKDCSDFMCSTCQPCATPENRYQMREAFREHTHEGNFRRLFPTKLHFYDKQLISNMTESNKVSIEWFRGKCESNDEWC